MLAYYDAPKTYPETQNTLQFPDFAQRPGRVEESALATVGIGARVGEILKSVGQEAWLPLSLRSLIIERLIALRELCRSGEFSLEACKDCMAQIALGCFAYDHLTERSRTLRGIRTLDLELSEGDASAMIRVKRSTDGSIVVADDVDHH